MSAQHTPGPWHFEEGDSGDASVGMQATPPYIYADPEADGNVYPICALDEPQRRASREPVDEYDECMESAGTHEANARLIAAAPDLLAALQRLSARFLAPDLDNEFARAAINKATGTAS